MRWHFYLTPAADGAHNMALDEALMCRARRTGDAVFRMYGWSTPTLSLGRNQRARGCYYEEVSGRLGVNFVRRPTGGRALLHDHEVTYSVTMPVRDGQSAGAPRMAYDFINDVLLDALARVGLAANRATNTIATPPGVRPCFDAPSEHEIVVDGRKLIGSAQWLHDGALLQHGSILVRDDQPVIAHLLKNAAPGAPAAATLSESLGWEPTPGELAAPLLQSLEAAVGSCIEPLSADVNLNADVEHLRARYQDDTWTWRR
jgi:lipoate-protein ligase A